MSICDTCTKTNTVPECTTNLTIGTIPDLNQDVIVHFKDFALGRTKTITATSDGSGLVVIDLSTVGWVVPDRTFEVFIIKDTATGQHERLTITTGAESADCLLLEFNRTNPIGITDHTLAPI